MKWIGIRKLDVALVAAIVALAVVVSWYVWMQNETGCGIARRNILASAKWQH